MKKHIIKNIDSNSIAKEIELQIGDELISMNGVIIEDIIDYKYYEKDEELELLVFRPSTNEEWEIFIEKEDFEVLGIEFEDGIMDDYKSCHNKCVFCFIDQLPSGMRETMYFKDDDARLSFLQGNYITLTNMKEKDFARIINYRLSPINLSIHTMNMELRKDMLKNRFAGKLSVYMDRLFSAGILMNGQIVLCKGINDKEELRYSIESMLGYMPFLQSVSIVPVGLTRFRDHLEKLSPFTKEDALDVIELVDEFQQKALAFGESHFIHAADEFYFLAGKEIPHGDSYDGYLQYENGVGMTRLLKDEFEECYNSFNSQKSTTDNKKSKYSHLTIVTGKLIESTIKEMANKVMQNHNVQIDIIGITNDYFGHLINVSGLITGTDIIKQAKSSELGEVVYIPSNMLKSDEDVFLDNVTLSELETRLERKTIPLALSGKILFEAMLGKEINYE